MTKGSVHPGSTDPTSIRAKPSRPRWILWLLGALLLFAGLVVVLLVALRQPPIATAIAKAFVARIHPLPRAQLEVSEVRGDWLTQLDIHGLRMTRGDTLLAGVESVRVRYSLATLFAGELHVRELEIDGLFLTPELFAKGPETRPSKPRPSPLTLADLLRGRFYSGPAFRIDRLTVRGGLGSGASSDSERTTLAMHARDFRLGRTFTFALDSLRARRQADSVSGVDLDLAATLNRGRFHAPLLRFRGDSSAVDGNALVALDSRDSVTEARLVLNARPLRLRDLAAVVPLSNLEGVVLVEVDVRGARRDRLSGTIGASTKHLRLGLLEIDAARVSATLTEGRSDTWLSGSVGGARMEVNGWVRPFDSTPTYDLEIESERLPTRLPAPDWWPRFAERASSHVALHVRGSGFARPVADVKGTIDGKLGHVEVDGGLDLTRGVDWSLRRLRFVNVDVARLTGDSIASSVSGTLTSSARDAASPARRVVAELSLEPSTYGGWQVTSGHARATLDRADVGASLALASEAGNFEIESLAGRWDETGAFRLKGVRFRDLDLAKITRNPGHASHLSGSVSGRFRGVRAVATPPGAQQALREGRVSGEMRVDLSASRWGRRSVGPGSFTASLAGGTVRFGGRIESDAGHLDLAGRARPFDKAPSYWLDRGQFSEVDLAAWTGSDTWRSSLRGSVTANARSGAGPKSSATWQGTLRLDPSRLGTKDIEGGEVRVWGSEGSANLTADLGIAKERMSARGEMVTRGNVPRGHAELSIPLAVVAALAGDTSRASGRIDAQTTFEGLVPDRAVLDGTVVGQGRIGAARLDSLFAGFHLRRGILQVDTLITRSNVAVAMGGGHVALFDSTATSDFRLAMRVNDLAPLRRLLGADTLAVDTATVDVRMFASGRTQRFEARISVRSLAWNEARLHRADGSIVSDLDSGWRPVRTKVIASLARLRGVGGTVNEAMAQVETEGGRTRFDLTGSRDKTHRLHLVGHSTRDTLGQRATLEKLDIQADSASWALAKTATIALRPNRLEVENFDLRSAHGGRLAAEGVIDRRGRQSFRLDMKDVGLGVVAVLLGREGIAGVLNGNLALDGPATAPHGSGNIRLALTSDGQPAGVVRSTLAWDGARLGFGGGFTTPKNDSIAWTGDLPLALSLAIQDSTKTSPLRVAEGDVELRLSAQHFPLEALTPLLDPRTIGDLQGTLDLDARLKGTSRAVTGQGRIAVTGGVVPLPGLGVTYGDIDLQAVFEGDKLVFRRAHATSSKGSLDASGDVRFIGVTRVEPRLHLDIRHFVFVDSPDLRAVTSGKIDLSGTLTSPVVRGNATIENSSLYLTPAESSAEQPTSAVKLTDEDLRMMEETFGEVELAAPNAALEFYDASDLDLAIRLERNNWVRQRAKPKLAVALTGDVRLKKAPHGEPQLFGRIEPLPNRGYVEQFARSFDIKGGEIFLNGPMKDHQVNLQAQYKPPTSSEDDEDETIINLEVEGTMEKPRLTLSSEPPMSEAEIVSFIATGQSSSKPASSDQSASLAKDIGLSQVTGFAEEAAQEAIGLDVLQVRFDALQGATLVAGRYLDNQLYVGFRQPLQYKDSSPESGVTTKTSFEVEYAIYRWLLLNLQGETSKVRSFFRVRYAY